MKNNNEYGLESFCYKVRDAVEEYYHDEKEIKVQTVKKNNGVILMGITIMEKGMNVAPTIYLNDVFSLYEKEGDRFGDIVMKVINIYEKNKLKKDFDISFFKNFEEVKNKISMRLINREMNAELLKEVPYEDYYDLALVCYCNVMREDIGNGAILVKNEHLKLWNIKKEDLLALARRNTNRYFAPHLQNMVDVVAGMMDPDDVERIKKELKDDHAMYVLSNIDRMYGATTIIYPGLLQNIGMQLKKDFYVLPSSVHEVILVPAGEDTDGKELSEMVNEINKTQVSKEEILANHAYLYHYRADWMEILPLNPQEKN